MIFRRVFGGGAQIGSAMPPKIEVMGSAGSSAKAAAEDHTHAARVQRKIVTLDANGVATWTFTRPFDAEPSIQALIQQTSGEPVVVEVTGFVMVGGQWTGVTIKGFRSRAMPTLQPLNVLAILGAVVTGVNTLVSALSNFNVFQGGNLNGVRVHLSAGDQM